MSIYERLSGPTCPKRRIRRLCAEAFGVEEHRLVGASRERDIVVPRQATYYVLRKRFPDMSLPRIGRFMVRDHSTVSHGIRVIEAPMEEDDALRQLVQALVKGRLPEEQDAHVRQWQVELAYRQRTVRAVKLAAPAIEPDSELGEFIDPTRMFCAQCDRSVTGIEAARCEWRLCGISGRRAA